MRISNYSLINLWRLWQNHRHVPVFKIIPISRGSCVTFFFCCADRPQLMLPPAEAYICVFVLGRTYIIYIIILSEKQYWRKSVDLYRQSNRKFQSNQNQITPSLTRDARTYRYVCIVLYQCQEGEVFQQPSPSTLYTGTVHWYSSESLLANSLTRRLPPKNTNAAMTDTVDKTTTNVNDNRINTRSKQNKSQQPLEATKFHTDCQKEHEASLECKP